MRKFFREVAGKSDLIAILTGIFTFGVALASYAWLGTYSRLYADDYCMSGLVAERGFWQAQVAQYMGWSNRFAGMLVLSLSDYFGSNFIRLWTVFVLLTWLAALTWALMTFTRYLRIALSRLACLMLAEGIIFFSILFSPQVYQSFFWRVGIITYTLPLVFLCLLVGIIFQQMERTRQGKVSVLALVGLGLLSFFAGGFSETYIALQTGMYTLALIAALIFVPNPVARNNWLRLLGVGLGASLLSLAVVLLSPGNAVRMAAMPPHPSLVELLRMTLLHTFLFIFGGFNANPFQYLLAFLIPFFLANVFFADKNLPHWKSYAYLSALLLIPALAIVLVAGVMLPAAYAQSSYPDGRVLVSAAFIVSLMLTWMGLLAGLAFARLGEALSERLPTLLRLALVVVLITSLLYPLYDAHRNSLQILEFSSRAASWDRRAAAIQQAIEDGDTDLVVKGLNAPGGLAELRGDPSDWVNGCAAQFYGVRSIVTGAP